MEDNIKIIAHIYNDFTTKFGIPRQSGIVKSVLSRIVFEPEYRNADALRGLEDFSHLWLVWKFSEAVRDDWSPMVRPPRLGGNTKKGVFSTRSPFRPNPIGLSAVKIENIDLNTSQGPVIVVSGADLMNGTPIYDIKPYIPYTDAISDAKGGFANRPAEYLLEVIIPNELKSQLPEGDQETIIDLLAHDPRPSYQNDSERIYGMTYGKHDIRFRVVENTLTVVEIIKL